MLNKLKDEDVNVEGLKEVFDGMYEEFADYFCMEVDPTNINETSDIKVVDAMIGVDYTSEEDYFIQVGYTLFDIMLKEFDSFVH